MKLIPAAENFIAGCRSKSSSSSSSMDLLSTLSQSKSKSSSLSIVKKVYGEVPAAPADDFFSAFFCLRINSTKFIFYFQSMEIKSSRQFYVLSVRSNCIIKYFLGFNIFCRAANYYDIFNIFSHSQAIYRQWKIDQKDINQDKKQKAKLKVKKHLFIWNKLQLGKDSLNCHLIRFISGWGGRAGRGRDHGRVGKSSRREGREGGV